MRWIAVFWILLLPTSILAGSPHAPAPLPEDSVKIMAARHKIFDIWRAAQVYHEDRGSWASTVDELDSLNYVTLDSTLRADWAFTLIGNPPSAIRATQNYLAKNANQSGFGLPHSVEYDIESGEWSGSGIPIYGRTELTREEQSLLVQQVQSSMYALSKASPEYYMDRGEQAVVVDLVNFGYVKMPNSVKLNWQILMYGPDSLVAVSTMWMPDGPDQRIVYYPKEGRYSGYGVIDPNHVPSLTPYLEYVEPKK